MTRLSTDILDQMDRNARYGVGETNPVGDIQYYLAQLTGEKVMLSDRRLVKIERLRLIGWSREYTAWDISYCYGRLANGDLVDVDLGVSRIVCAGGDAYKRELVKLCQRAGKFGKALGIFDAVSTLRG